MCIDWQEDKGSFCHTYWPELCEFVTCTGAVAAYNYDLQACMLQYTLVQHARHRHTHTHMLCMHTYTHMHTHTHTHTHMYACTHAHTHSCMHMHACTDTHARTHACTRTHTHTHSVSHTNSLSVNQFIESKPELDGICEKWHVSVQSRAIGQPISLSFVFGFHVQPIAFA